MPIAVEVGAGALMPVVLPPDGDRLLALNPRGTRLAISCEGADTVQVFDARTGREVTRCQGLRRIAGVAFLSAEVLLVTAAGGCFRCDLRGGGREVLSSEAWPGCATVSPKGRIVAIGVKRGLDLHDARTGKELRHLETYFAEGPGGVAGGDLAAFSADERYVAAALGTGYGWPYLVVVWEVHTGRRQRVFETLARALAFRDDSLSLALADDWSHIQLYEPDQGEDPAVRFDVASCLRALRFRDGGRTLEALLDGGGLVRYEARTGRILRQVEPPAADQIRRAVVSRDWSRFAGATECGVVIWPGDSAEEK